MSERCRHCEQYEKRQSDVRERRVHLWRRGEELTDAARRETDFRGATDHRRTERASGNAAQAFALGDGENTYNRPGILKKRSAAVRMNCMRPAASRMGTTSMTGSAPKLLPTTGTAPKTAVRATAHLGSSAVIIGNA